MNKFSSEYKVLIDSQQFEFSNVFLDKDNIKSVRIDKQEKVINITQISQNKLFELKDFKLDSLFPHRRIEAKRKIGLIVIDGIVVYDSLKAKTKIDLNAIESLQVITQENLDKNVTWCKGVEGDVLLLKTK